MTRQLDVPAHGRRGHPGVRRTRPLIQIKKRRPAARISGRMWRRVTTAPFDCDLELAVLDEDGPHALVFPCRRILSGWIKVETGERIAVDPTHWRPWREPTLRGAASASAAD